MDCSCLLPPSELEIAHSILLCKSYVHLIVIIYIVDLLYTLFYTFSVLNVANGAEVLYPTIYGHGISNVNEAELVARMILFLTQLPALKTKEIGIVAFSMAQKHELVDRIHKK